MADVLGNGDYLGKQVPRLVVVQVAENMVAYKIVGILAPVTQQAGMDNDVGYESHFLRVICK